MKICHLLKYAPHTSGLYETARELIELEVEAGVDARFLDTGGRFHPYLRDRGVRSCDLTFLKECDLVVMHQNIHQDLLKAVNKPIILALHGTPRDCMWGEVYENSGSHSVIMGFGKDPRFSFLTFWERHMTFWENLLPNVSCCPAPVIRKYFNHEVTPYKFRGKAEGTPNVLYADSWRIDKKPYEVAIAFKLFKKEFPKARLHVLCQDPSQAKAFNLFFERLSGMQDNFFGLYEGYVKNFPSFAKAADFVITPQRDGTRIIRESLAVGTPVVAASSCRHTKYHADFYYPDKFSSKMVECWTDIQNSPEKVLSDCQKTIASNFNSVEVSKRLLEIFKKTIERGVPSALSPKK